jgi:ABC-type branched-subunit amino acid transport system substrate-binding protein
VGALAVACSSSSKSSSGSGTSAPAASSATSGGSGATTGAPSSAAPALAGDPVVIGSIYPISSPAVSFPDLEYMAQIAVNVVNDSGGIKGRPLKWVHCDDKSDPNVAAQCADQIINQDKVMALVMSVGLEGNVVWPIAKNNNLVNWFNVPIFPDDTTSPLSYPAGLGIYAHQNVGMLVKQGEFKKVECMAGENPLATQICGFAKDALAQKGITNFNMITYPLTTTAFAPYATKVVADGADAVVVVGADSITAPVMQALSDAGAKVTMLEPSTSVGSHTVDAATKTGTPLRVAGGWGVDASTFPGRKQMLADVQKYASKVGAPAGFDTLSDNAINMYQGILKFAQGMNAAPSVSMADFQAYVAAHPLTTGMSPTIDWSKAGPIAGKPRVVTVYATPETVKNGQLVSSSTTFSSGFPGVPDAQLAT